LKHWIKLFIPVRNLCIRPSGTLGRDPRRGPSFKDFTANWEWSRPAHEDWPICL